MGSESAKSAHRMPSKGTQTRTIRANRDDPILPSGVAHLIHEPPALRVPSSASADGPASQQRAAQCAGRLAPAHRRGHHAAARFSRAGRKLSIDAHSRKELHARTRTEPRSGLLAFPPSARRQAPCTRPLRSRSSACGRRVCACISTPTEAYVRPHKGAHTHRCVCVVR